MSDSYLSSRTGDPSLNGFPNGSSPLVPTPAVSSVIRKKLMGYVGFANLPNQVHRKSVRKGFQFTAMVVGMLFPPFLTLQHVSIFAFLGESGLGKSTLINTLFDTTLYPPKQPLPPAAERPKTVAIESIGAGASNLLVQFPRVNLLHNRYRGEWCSTSFNCCRYTWLWGFCQQ